MPRKQNFANEERASRNKTAKPKTMVEGTGKLVNVTSVPVNSFFFTGWGRREGEETVMRESEVGRLPLFFFPPYFHSSVFEWF